MDESGTRVHIQPCGLGHQVDGGCSQNEVISGGLHATRALVVSMVVFARTICTRR